MYVVDQLARKLLDLGKGLSCLRHLLLDGAGFRINGDGNRRRNEIMSDRSPSCFLGLFFRSGAGKCGAPLGRAGTFPPAEKTADSLAERLEQSGLSNDIDGDVRSKRRSGRPQLLDHVHDERFPVRKCPDSVGFALRGGGNAGSWLG